MYLEIQKALNQFGFDQVVSDYSLKVCEHPTLPLVIFNYHMLDSPRNKPVTNEARGLVLEKGTWNVVARAFYRFWNMGEFPHLMKEFGGGDPFWGLHKEDGTLLNLFNYQGNWMVTTRGSFANWPMQTPRGEESDVTWEEFFWTMFPKELLSSLDPDYTYNFEGCSLKNKVVREYPEDRLFLLAAQHNHSASELSEEELDCLGVSRPERHLFNTPDECSLWAEEKSKVDATHEGLVLRDKNNMRWKVKSSSYVHLHHLYSGIVPTNRNIYDIVNNGEDREVLTYFPELGPAVSAMRKRISSARKQIQHEWELRKDISSPRDFALKIQNFPYKAFLFLMKNKNLSFEEAWVESEKWRLKTFTSGAPLVTNLKS